MLLYFLRLAWCFGWGMRNCIATTEFAVAALIVFHFYLKVLGWRCYWFVFAIQCGFACFHMSTQARDLLTFGIWTIEQSLMFSLSKQVRYLNSKLLWISYAPLSLWVFNQSSIFGNPLVVFLCIQCTYLQECVKNNYLHSCLLFPLGSEEFFDAMLIVHFASQRCSFNISYNQAAHSPFSTVTPINASILSHLHHDSFDCHFTPFIGSVWTPPPQPCPGIPDLLLWQCPLLGCGLRMEIEQSCSNIPTPSLPMHHYSPATQPPPIIIPRGLKSDTGVEHLFPKLFLLPGDPPSQLVSSWYPHWSYSISFSVITSHTHILYCCTPFSSTVFYLVTQLLSLFLNNTLKMLQMAIP